MAGKRGNGEGMIRRRPNGLWEARISLPDGKRKCVYGKTQADVLVKLEAVRHDLGQGLPVLTDERQTVATWLASWLEAIRASVKPRTWTRYEGEVRNHLIPQLGALRLRDLRAAHVQAVYTALSAQGYAPASVAHLHAVLHKALDAAMRQGLVPRNVVSLATAPNPRSDPDRREMRPLTATETATLLDAARGHRLEALYVVAVATGMRLGELLALTWADLDLDAARPILSVRHSLHHEGAGAWRLTSPKTKRGERRITLSPATVASFRAHRARQLEERLKAGAGWHEHDFVFTRADGEPLRGTHVLEHYFRPLLKRAGLPEIRFHDLRHTAATLLRAGGTDILAISRMLGHADVAITLGVYGHVTGEMEDHAATVMERVIGRAGRGT